jgi:hypothetical protein
VAGSLRRWTPLYLSSFPKTGKGHRLFIPPVDEVWDLEVGISLPRIKSTRGNQATPTLIAGLGDPS